jgi:hypothetical protein
MRCNDGAANEAAIVAAKIQECRSP